MIFIFVTLLIDVLGIGIVIPVIPDLITHFIGVEKFGEESFQQINLAAQAAKQAGNTSTATQQLADVVSAASRWGGILVACYAITQFFFAPIVGALSDQFGRRPVLLLTMFGLGLDYLLQANAPSLGWLFVGRIIAGIMGASFTSANAYIADISTDDNRARNFGLVGVAFGLGFALGPALGGLLGSYSLRLPFFVSAGLALVNWLYGYFVLPESLLPENRSRFTRSKLNPFGALMKMKAYPLVSGLAFAIFFVSLAQRGLENVWVYFTKYRYGWEPWDNGRALGLVGIMAIIVQGGMVRPVIKRIGERKAVLYGISIAALAFMGYACAYQGWMIPCVIVFGSLGGVAQPAIQSIVAKSVSPSEQGQMQGALTSLRSVTSIFAPLVFTTGLFNYFTAEAAPVKLPGSPFFVGSLLQIAALIVIYRLFRRIPEPAELSPSK